MWSVLGLRVRLCFGIGMVGALSGCIAPNEGVSGLFEALRRPTPDQIRTTTFLDGGYHIVAPEGYCFDRKSIQSDDMSATAFMGVCSSVQGVASRAVIMVSATRADTTVKRPEVEDVKTLYPKAQLLRSEATKERLLVELLGAHPLNTQDRLQYWRGFQAQGSVLLGAAVFGDDQFSSQDGKDMILSVLDNMVQIRSSRTQGPKEAPKTQQSQSDGLQGFWNRLFPNKS